MDGVFLGSLGMGFFWGDFLCVVIKGEQERVVRRLHYYIGGL